MNDTAKFLEMVFGMWVGVDSLLLIWGLPSKRAAFFDTVSAAIEYVDGQGGDVYCGCGLYRPGLPAGRRGGAADVVALPALWADIDFGVDRAKGSGSLPPDEIAANGLLDQLGPRPSIIVHSGHGLHVWWLFTELLAVDDSDVDVAVLARRWVRTIQACAKTSGWRVDSVGDLARVLRVPGTSNHKGGRIVPVRLMVDNPVRYEHEEMESWCTVEGLESESNNAVVTVAPLSLGTVTIVPQGKLEALQANDPRFKRTWNRQRSDMADQSASAYDLAIAHAAGTAGFSDQEIVALILAWREKHGESTTKARRRDYLQSTIAKAKVLYTADQALGKLSTAVTCSQPLDARRRAEMIDQLSKVLGVAVKRWVQLGEENATYTLLLVDGTDIPIGRVDAVISQRIFRGRIYEATRVLPALVKAGSWDRVCRGLGQIVEIEINTETSRAGQIEDWVAGYLRAVKPIDAEDHSFPEHVAEGKPFTRNDWVYISAADLVQHVRYTAGDQIARHSLYPMFRAAGWTPHKVPLRLAGKPVGKRYWRCRRPQTEIEQYDYEAATDKEVEDE